VAGQAAPDTFAFAIRQLTAIARGKAPKTKARLPYVLPARADRGECAEGNIMAKKLTRSAWSMRTDRELIALSKPKTLAPLAITSSSRTRQFQSEETRSVDQTNSNAEMRCEFSWFCSSFSQRFTTGT
jgi:hypothetical protein